MKTQIYPIVIEKKCKNCGNTHHNTYVWEKDDTGTWINCDCGSTLLILNEKPKEVFNKKRNTRRIMG